MKTVHLHIVLLFLAVAAMAAACTPSHRDVNNPLIEAANSLTMDITRVELTDSATTLHVELYGYPGLSVRISDKSVIKADGETYCIKSAKGITMNKWLRLPKSGLTSCTLTFQPIPVESKSMDFIESDDGFKLFGIDLTGKTEYPKYPAELPKDLRRNDNEKELPEQVFKCATSTVRVHLLGFREGMDRTVKLHMQPFLGSSESLTSEADPASNTAEFTFMQYGTMKAALSAISGASVYSHVWVEPGQTTDVYLDLGKTGRLLVERRAQEKTDEYQYFNYMCPAYTTGRYAALNRAYTHMRQDIRISLNPEVGFDADDYVSMVERAYANAIDSVRSNSRMTGMQKLYNEMQLDMELMKLAFAAPIITSASTNPYRLNMPKLEFTPEHIRRMLRPIDFNDMKYAIDGMVFTFATSLYDTTWFDKVQLADDNFYREYDEVRPLFSAAASDMLTDEERARLEHLTHPFFREACLTAEAEIRAAAAAAEGKIRIEPTPDVDNDSLLDAIVGQYAGKVVFVDFWNTWCTWCHVGFDNFKPMRSGDLADKVVWLYIADESSPIAVYKSTIADLGGVHYRITEQQMAAITEKYGLKGFPSYMIIGRDGSRDMRNDLSDTATAEKRLRAQLKK